MTSLELDFFPIDSRPYGLSYADWSIRWWQWISSIPKDSNPALDWTGKKVYENQDDSRVLFLCQTYEGVKKTPFRRSKITEGKAIFMPIINWISIMNHDGESDKQLLEIARKRMDVVGPLEITINGITINSGLEKYRVQSTYFEIDLPRNNLFDIQSGKRRCVSDGYWLFLHPIYDNLRLSSFSSCSSGVTRIKVNYELTMKR
jgi:hypothetical protein